MSDICRIPDVLNLDIIVFMIRTHTLTMIVKFSFKLFVFMLTFNLRFLNQSLMAHLYNAIPQHHCLFLSAKRDKLALCSILYISKVSQSSHWILCTMSWWHYSFVCVSVCAYVCVAWTCACVCTRACVWDDRRCTSLHLNIKTTKYLFLINDATWGVCWGWQISGWLTYSLIGLIILLLSLFLKVMSLCHLHPLYLFTCLVIHTALGFAGKVAGSFGMNWPIPLGCNGPRTCWCFHHFFLRFFSPLARWFQGMLGIQPSETSMMAGFGLLYGGNVYGGGISSGTLHWLETSTSRYSQSDFMWKSMKKDCASSQPLGATKCHKSQKKI